MTNGNDTKHSFLASCLPERKIHRSPPEKVEVPRPVNPIGPRPVEKVPQDKRKSPDVVI